MKGGRVISLRPARDQVALTFDDGPNNKYTPQILAILQHFGVTATFFTIGFEVAEFPDVVRQEQLAGMTIGNHSWDHPTSSPFRDLPADRIRSEMQKTIDALHKEGVDPYLFRPPGGTYGDTELNIAQELGMRVVLWSVDPVDWPPGVTAPFAMPMPTSRISGSSTFSRCGGLGIHNATTAAGVEDTFVPQARFSDAAHTSRTTRGAVRSPSSARNSAV